MVLCPDTFKHKVNIDDAGRSASKRSKQTSDCTVRAVAKVMGVEYDTAYDLLKAGGRKSGRSFDLGGWLDKPDCPITCQKSTYKAVKGQPRLKLGSFVDLYGRGKHIVFCAKHVIAVINGELFDDFQPDMTKTVYKSYRVL